MPRQPNGESSIYKGADGRWHTYVWVGGDKPRRHISGKTATAVAVKVEALKANLRIGHVPEVGKAGTLGEWLEHYLTVICPRRVRGSTLQGYESTLRHNIIPAIGRLRLSMPIPEIARRIEVLFAGYEKRVKPSTAKQTFGILDKALDAAVRKGKLARNPCDLVDPPTTKGWSSPEVEPLTAPEIRRILEEARRCAALARWWVALALGLRQGETLGLMWDYIDLDSKTPTLRVQWELIRLKWRHGCDDTPCGKRAASCPDRTGGGLVFEPPKSGKGRRTLALPKAVVQILKEHRRLLKEAKLALGPRMPKTIVGPNGESGGLVFPRADGSETDPRDDWGQWKDILVAANVRQVERVTRRGRHAGETYTTSKVRVHDTRHSAGTTMFLNGMDRKELMEWLGHSQISQSARYTHVTPEMMQARAEQLNPALEQLLQPGPATRRRRRSS